MCLAGIFHVIFNARIAQRHSMCFCVREFLLEGKLKLIRTPIEHARTTRRLFLRIVTQHASARETFYSVAN